MGWLFRRRLHLPLSRPAVSDVSVPDVPVPSFVPVAVSVTDVLASCDSPSSVPDVPVPVAVFGVSSDIPSSAAPTSPVASSAVTSDRESSSCTVPVLSSPVGTHRGKIDPCLLSALCELFLLDVVCMSCNKVAAFVWDSEEWFEC